MRILLIVSAMLVVWVAASLRADLKPTTLEKPVNATVALDGKPGVSVAGQLVRYDAETLVIKTAKGEQTLKWSELTPASRYNIRATIADKKDAEAWLDLAELAMQAGMREQAKVGVNRAATIDPKTRLRGEAILRGQGNAKPAAPAVSAGSGAVATTRPAVAATGPSKGHGIEGVAIPMKVNDKVVFYEKSTPQQDAAAIKLAQEVAAGVTKQLKIQLAEFQTAHFIVFTDWDPREYGFLKTNLEKAYSVVSKEFNIPDKDNVFVGKLPVFMFAKQADFAKYTAVVEGFPAQPGLLGYYRGHGDGSGHLVMWKPDVKRYGDVRIAELQWAYTLTHEFTHAFVARYRTNRNVPRWLHEGVAEVIAARQFPVRGAHSFARQMAEQPFDFQGLFDDEKRPGGEMYPVMRTMVEALLADDYKAFLAMFKDIKDGVEPEAALKKHYKATYEEFEQAWRGYARKLRE